MAKLPKETQVKQVKLKVADLEKMITFYTTMVGLVLVKKEQNSAFLSAQGSEGILLILEELAAPEKKIMTTGLYHTAFLLPSRKDLGNTLLWLLQNKVELGAADHGYSEALYLTDPEGNGIEIYHDKPMSEWDIREDGQIIGVTEELDGDSLVASSDGKWLGLPFGSRIGHIHLQVADLEKSAAFYEQLGFSLKSDFGKRAKFFAAGTYHHHIGMNTWAGSNLPLMTENQLGLAWYVFKLPTKEDFEALVHELEQQDVEYKLNQHQLIIADPNGTQIIFES
jgi:catechol 2,3-dioxygenase